MSTTKLIDGDAIIAGFQRGQCAANGGGMLASMIKPVMTSVMIGDRIRESREQLGMNQTQLAEAVGRIDPNASVRQSQISNIEKGVSYPTAPGLRALAIALETSTDYLLGLTENQLSAQDVEEELAAGGIGGQYERVMARLSPERQAQALDYARYLSELERAAQEQERDLRRIQAVVTLLLRDAPPERIREVKAELSALPPALANEVRAMLDARDAPPADGKQQAG